MTAEIALLNKSAIALAADSAATVSAQDRQEKVFNSEDKLFELSLTQPIGIMISNSTTFFETPVHVLIKKYRALGREFDTVEDAAVDFRVYLRNFARSLDREVVKRNFQRLMNSPIQLVHQRFLKELIEKSTVFDQDLDPSDRFKQVAINLERINNDHLLEDCMKFYRSVFENASKAEFTGRSAIKIIGNIAAQTGKGDKQDASQLQVL